MAREEQPGGRGREKREQPHSEQDRPYSEQARPAQLAHPVSCRKHGHPERRVQARVRVVVHEEVAQGGPGQQRAGPGRQKRSKGPERAGLLAEIAAAGGCNHDRVKKTFFLPEVAIMTMSKKFYTEVCNNDHVKNLFTGGCNHDHVKKHFYRRLQS